MIAYVGRVMTRAAKSRDARLIEHIVETVDAGDVDNRIVEHFFTSRDRFAVGHNRTAARKPQPRFVQIEDGGVERRAVRIVPQGIVDADEEVRKLQRERYR